jgi:ribosomal protein L7/L12
MFMADKPAVLVTGGAGYIGSHACKALAGAGYVPVCYDNLSQGHHWAVKWGPFERGDVLDRGRLDDVLNHYDFVGAMHFAAFTEVAESVKDPARFYHNNVGGTANLVSALVAQGIKALVFSSTAAVYGVPIADVALNEDAALRPINPYGESKLAVIKAVRMITDLALREAKQAVDTVPFTVKAAVSKDEAESLKTQLEVAGGTVELS